MDRSLRGYRGQYISPCILTIKYTGYQYSVGDPDPDLGPHVLGLTDLEPDPLVRGTDPDLNPSLFHYNACKIKFEHKILAKN